MEQFTKSGSQGDTRMVINSGDRLTIETIAGFIQLIRKGLTETTTVVIEFDPNVEMDITALQFFCSACKTALAEGKRFTHRGPPPKALLELLAAVGAECHEHCINDNMACFRQLGGMEKWEN